MEENNFLWKWKRRYMFKKWNLTCRIVTVSTQHFSSQFIKLFSLLARFSVIVTLSFKKSIFKENKMAKKKGGLIKPCYLKLKRLNPQNGKFLRSLECRVVLKRLTKSNKYYRRYLRRIRESRPKNSEIRKPKDEHNNNSSISKASKTTKRHEEHSNNTSKSSIENRQTDLPNFDTLSVSLGVDKKDLKKMYRRRCDLMTSLFNKWKKYDNSEDKEVRLEKEGNWNCSEYLSTAKSSQHFSLQRPSWCK